MPRSASAETFTWGMAVSDDAAARKFYGETLGLTEFDPWNLPVAGGLKMYLFSTGAGRVKFSAPPGQRPREADAGPDAPGLRSVTLRVADLAAVRAGLAKRGAKMEGEKRLLVTDPDGNRIYIEQAPPRWPITGRRQRDGSKTVARRRAPKRPQSTLDRIRAQYGNITPKPHKEEIAEQRPGEPPLKKMPDGDPARDAAGRGQLFESICVPGITDLQEGMNGVAIVDLNKDGLLDIVATYSPLRGTGGGWGAGEKLRVFINEGDFKFRPAHDQAARLEGVTGEFRARPGAEPRRLQRRRLLDLFVTRHAQMSGGQSNPQ